MSQFPPARPTKAAPQERDPYGWKTHPCTVGVIFDADGVAVCVRPECGHRADHKIHAVAAVAGAAEVDARRLGEATE